ncbi:hypothetical protein JTE90_002817 [Oedothorax gibbosus]|uniref:Uncharacterized protein n=1 Tax=Oedothorax gibbosus TaxID=931172 RepID=A0AAV6U6H5_9ARAC|nr:hypothetical protein JTE90_002817 [Oedothorax gibbosus]
MLFLPFFVCTLPAVLATCVFPSEDEAESKPKGLEERALDSEVVLAAYTRTIYKNRNASTSFYYSAEFLVFNVIKGEDSVGKLYQKRKPSSLETALNRRLVNVSSFGDPSKCESDVSPGETYILLLDVLESGELAARYDGAYGPAVVYSRDKETALEAIGSSPWGEWSPCSGSCGGGIQQRIRQCDGGGKCTNEDGQQRTCNMFSCSGILNILEVAGVHRSSLRPSSRPTAFKLLPSGSWRSRREELTFPRTFPWEFSLLVTVRVKQSSTGGFLLRVLHSDSLQVGLYISDILTLVLSDKKNIRVSFVKSLFDDRWHQISFSVRRDTVSFYLNCEYSGKLPLSGKIRPFGGIPATVIVGSTGDHELDAFQGDIEQLTISGSPDAAANQCNSTTTPLNFRGGPYAMTQEVRSKPVFTPGTQNDQLPRRADIIDDEDFTFETGSGDDGVRSDEEYDDLQEDKPSNSTTSHRDTKIPLKAETIVTEDDDDEEDEDDYDDLRDRAGDEEREGHADDDSRDDGDDDSKDEDKKDDEEEEDEDESDEEDDKSDKIEVDKVEKTSNDTKPAEPNHDLQGEDGDKKDDKPVEDSEKKKDVEVGTKTPEVSDKVEGEDGIVDDYEKDDTDTKVDEIVEDFEDEDPHKSTYDYMHPDEEKDKDDDFQEGSGTGPEIELAWSEWSPCSSSCNWGRRTRTSYCLDNGLNLERCAEASFKRSETEACFVKLCPTASTTTTPLPTTTTMPVNVTAAILRNSECKIQCLNGGICNPPYRCICPPKVYGSLCQYGKCEKNLPCKLQERRNLHPSLYM